MKRIVFKDEHRVADPITGVVKVVSAGDTVLVTDCLAAMIEDDIKPAPNPTKKSRPIIKVQYILDDRPHELEGVEGTIALITMKAGGWKPFEVRQVVKFAGFSDRRWNERKHVILAIKSGAAFYIPIPETDDNTPVPVPLPILNGEEVVYIDE